MHAHVLSPTSYQEHSYTKIPILTDQVTYFTQLYFALIYSCNESHPTHFYLSDGNEREAYKNSGNVERLISNAKYPVFSNSI